MASDDDEEMGRIIAAQLKAFREKFGRDPEPDEPIFFDPENSSPKPVPIPDGVMAKATLDALRKSVAPPEIIYAYKKTGRLLSESRLHKYPAEAIEEWNSAIEEYYALHGNEYEDDGDIVRPADHFAFEGQTLGKLEIEFLGRKVERPIRVEWKHTPDWEHYDERYGRLLSDVPYTPAYMHTVRVLLDPTDTIFDLPSDEEELEPLWRRVDVDVGEGFWGKVIDEAIEENIEKQCRAIDAKRRKTAGLS